jgi:P-type Ca2+ transporter type 2C
MTAGNEAVSGNGAQQPLGGLSGSEAAHRLKRDGYNELPSAKQRTVLHIGGEVVREPMFLLLIAAGLIYLLLGESSDALMLLAFVALAMSITIYQERKTERVLEALRDLSSPRALVIRDGTQIRIPGREVVKDDLLLLEEGDRIPADGILLECHDLLVDESLLTGESVSISKKASPPGVVADQPGGDESNDQVYSGSMVVQGGGLARISATGAATQIGRIGKALQTLTTEQSPLQREIGMLVKRFSIIGVAISLCLVALYGVTRDDWYNGLLAGISLAMSVLPEEFTVILTIFMALGAWRISRSHVLTRRTPVIETLGSATVLCVDKTGTLTQNRMSVKSVVIEETTYSLDSALDSSMCQAPPPALERVLEYSVLASEIIPFDPMEKAFHQCLAEQVPGSRIPDRAWALVHEYPLTSDMMAMTHVWKVPDRASLVIATKGAPESIARLCKFDAARTDAMLRQVQRLAAQGMRVLAVAEAEFAPEFEPDSEGGAWPRGPESFQFTWLGLVGLADPVRAGVPQAVRECGKAGIRVVMITGDYPATAQAIAKEVGLRHDRLMTGAELEILDDAALRDAVRDLNVFARIRPEQKLKLVNALKADGEIVAMTGDGVNDAPALKAAHIGISMGARGTDVAREASSLVLLNDDFSSIVQAIRLGRRIYGNLRKAMIYVVAVHFPIAGMAMLPLFFGAPPALAPVHIVFLEMLINPACSIVFEMERAEGDIMQRPPRALEERLFGTENLLIALLQGLGLLAAVAFVFLTGLRAGLPEAEARAGAFACLVIGNLALIIGNRSLSRNLVRLLRTPNRAQWWMLAGGSAALAAVLYLPELQRVFHFAPVHAAGMMSVALAAAAALGWFELVKFFFSRIGFDRPRRATVSSIKN